MSPVLLTIEGYDQYHIAGKRKPDILQALNKKGLAWIHHFILPLKLER